MADDSSSLHLMHVQAPFSWTTDQARGYAQEKLGSGQLFIASMGENFLLQSHFSSCHMVAPHDMHDLQPATGTLRLCLFNLELLPYIFVLALSCLAKFSCLKKNILNENRYFIESNVKLKQQ